MQHSRDASQQTNKKVAKCFSRCSSSKGLVVPVSFAHLRTSASHSIKLTRLFAWWRQFCDNGSIRLGKEKLLWIHSLCMCWSEAVSVLYLALFVVCKICRHGVEDRVTHLLCFGNFQRSFLDVVGNSRARSNLMIALKNWPTQYWMTSQAMAYPRCAPLGLPLVILRTYWAHFAAHPFWFITSSSRILRKIREIRLWLCNQVWTSTDHWI